MCVFQYRQISLVEAALDIYIDVYFALSLSLFPFEKGMAALFSKLFVLLSSAAAHFGVCCMFTFDYRDPCSVAQYVVSVLLKALV